MHTLFVEAAQEKVRSASGAEQEEAKEQLDELLEDRDNAEAEAQEASEALEVLLRGDGLSIFESFVRELDEFGGMAVADLGELAGLFNANPLLLQPLCAETIRANAVELDFDSFVSPGTKSGRRADYRMAPKRLAGTDAAFVLLKLDPGGSSDVHEHPGDEMIYVRSGSLDFHFENTGVVTRLEAGDFLHFYAEYQHWGHNPNKSNPTELLIVRFYQLERQATRQALAHEIQNKLDTKQPLSGGEVAWIRQLLPPLHAGSPPVDGVGLNRFLNDWETAGLESERIGDDARPRYYDQSFDIAELESISRERGIEPFLLKHFAMPAQPSPVVVRSKDYQVFDVNLQRAAYRLPVRNLSCSDISIAKVRLDGRLSSGESGDVEVARTTFHRHPGFEAIFVTRGRIRLNYEGDEENAAAYASRTQDQICHFRSAILHSIANDSLDEPAEYIVIRFYRDGAVPRSAFSPLTDENLIRRTGPEP